MIVVAVHLVGMVVDWVLLVLRTVVVATAWLAVLPYSTVSFPCHGPDHFLPLTQDSHLQLWLFDVYIKSGDSFASALYSAFHPAHEEGSGNTTGAGMAAASEPFARLASNLTHKTLSQAIRRVVGTSTNSAGDLTALFRPVTPSGQGPTGWSRLLR